jgi:hypothetical protein
MSHYQEKYLKYKNKYNYLKLFIGGAEEHTFTDTGDYQQLTQDCEGFSLVKNTAKRGNYLLGKNGTYRTISSINKEGTSVTIKVEKQAGSGGGFSFQEPKLQSFIRYLLEQDNLEFPLTGSSLQEFLENYQFIIETAREIETHLS